MDYPVLRKRIVEAFPDLSPQLQKAARFVLDRPDEVGLSTLRRVADLAGVQPATVVRLVRAVGCEGYRDFRRPFSERLRGRSADYAARARTLQTRQKESEAAALLGDLVEADVANLRGAFEANPTERLVAFAEAVRAAPRVYVLGLRGSFPVAFALHYGYSMFHPDGVLVDGRGGTLADELRGLREGDALIAVGFSPYSDWTVRTLDYAAARGAVILAITDSAVSPLAKAARHTLLAPDDSPSFFQSFVAPLALAQALVALLAARGGEAVLDDLGESERQLANFNAYWTPPSGRAARPSRRPDRR